MTDAERQSKAKLRRAMMGLVRSISGVKTISVTVNTLVKHARYGKYVRRRTRLTVHDPSGTAAIGDIVEIAPCRRLSKTKSWRMVKIVRKATMGRIERK